MPFRPEIGLISCAAIAALLALGIVVEAPLTPTLITVGLFAATAFTLSHLSAIRARKQEERDDQRRKTIRHLDSWINVINALPVACTLIDKDKRVIHANNWAKDLAQIDRFGLPLTSYLRGSDISKALERAQAGYSTDPVDIHKLTLIERYLRVQFTPASLIRPSNSQSYLLAVITDITEDQVSHMQKADFLANASHELKTPIASLMGYIETLRHHAKDDPVAQEKFLGIMQKQAERMVRLIDDLLSLRKIEQSEHIAPEGTADLDNAIKSAIEALKPLADKRGVSLIYEGSQKAYTRANRDECVQLFLNLIDNATKFTPRGKAVKIDLSLVNDWSSALAFRDSSLNADEPSRRIAEMSKSQNQNSEGAWQIQIRDEGPGFAREHLPRIGERFYRIAGDLSSKEKGTGLGLAIVKHIVIRHRAGLYMRSSENVGTEFTIVFPKIASETVD